MLPPTVGVGPGRRVRGVISSSPTPALEAKGRRRGAFLVGIPTPVRDAHAVAELLGHADAALVTRRYGHALPDELASASEALSAGRRARGLLVGKGREL